MKLAIRKPARITGTDHGRRIGESAFDSVQRDSDFAFELIEGRIYVSPAPSPSHDDLVEWLRDVFAQYRKSSSSTIKHISGRARVYVPGRRPTTCPEPDLALYDLYPKRFPQLRQSWKDRSPFLVIEVSSSDYNKDLIRNVKLYAEVASIREYWVLVDTGQDENLSMRVYRRKNGGRWAVPMDVRFGDSYTTTVLPGFKFTLRPA